MEFLTPAQAASILGISARMLRKHLQRGLLPASKMGTRGDWVLTPAAVDEFSRAYMPNRRRRRPVPLREAADVDDRELSIDELLEELA